MLFLHQLADFIRVNALVTLLQVIPLLQQRDVRVPELVELGLLDCAIHVEHPRALTLRVKGQMFRASLLDRKHCQRSRSLINDDQLGTVCCRAVVSSVPADVIGGGVIVVIGGEIDAALGGA